MKTMSRILVVAAVAALAMGVVAWAQAPSGGGTQHPAGQGMGRGMGHGPGAMGQGPMDMLAKLNLTDQQKQEVHKLMAEAHPQQQADMQQMQTLHEQLKAQVFADGGPTGDPTATVQEISALQAKMMQAHVALAQKISGILTADQRRQVREMPMGDMMGMMGMGMTHGRGEK